MAVKEYKRWIIASATGVNGLQLVETPIPSIGEDDILVKFRSVSLNHRDLIILNGKNPFPIAENVVPGSDGAGKVIQVGLRVSEFKPGDRVVTAFFQNHLKGPLSFESIKTSLGALVDGPFGEYGVFPESGLVHAPSNLDWSEASTLSCAGLTAWNALYGDRVVGPGDTVLVQGTGGVSLFAMQFALAAGATVIATTSTAAKAEMLKRLGATHVLNYTEDPNWGETAKSLTVKNIGVEVVVDIGGAATMRQSLKAIRMEGIVSMVGGVGKVAEGQLPITTSDIFQSFATVRCIGVGNKQSFLEMNKVIEAKDIKPVLDKISFGFDDLKEAYQYMAKQNHIGKVVITIKETRE